MVEHSKVVVIGGGVTGCSILYHLAKMGCTDCILLERRELTSGSSWHAAGNLFTLTSPNTVSELQKYTFELYPKLEKESGQSTGFHPTGGLTLARSPEQTTAHKMAKGRGRRLGIDSDFITFEDAKKHAPILNTDLLDSILWEPMKGHVDPASATMAYAKAARKLGAKVYRNNEVVETNILPDNTWNVVTKSGSIKCDVVVNAAGLWAREVASMAGVVLPLMPVEHHYLVTETIPLIDGMTSELPSISDPESNLYSRQEGKGLLLGAYERQCFLWSEEATPLDFDHELLPNDLNRLEWNFERGCELFNVLREIGIKNVINGPMIFSPDLGPLMGPIEGIPNYYCACGVMTGFNQSGGVGRELAHWILDGEPSIDMFCWDIARFGDYVSKAYTKVRTRYFYENRSARIYPDQHLEAGRPIRTFPIYDKQKDMGAVFGESFGWEVPLWFGEPGQIMRDIHSYRRGNWFNNVGEECRTVRTDAGLFEISSFAKYIVLGTGAHEWLNFMLTNRIPNAPGRTCLTPMLNIKGRLIGEFSVTCIDVNVFMIIGAGTMQNIHMRHFSNYLPTNGNVKVQNISSTMAGLMLAGPKSRQILEQIIQDDLGADNFPFLTSKSYPIGNIPDCKLIRVSFTGEMGWEIYCPMEFQCTLYDELMKSGANNKLKLIGSRALMSLRLEKAFPVWGRDLSSDYTPFEAGLKRFMCFTKEGGFLGSQALTHIVNKSPSMRRVLLTVNSHDSDAVGGEAVLLGKKVIGYCSSGGYGHTIHQSLALAYIESNQFFEGEQCHLELLGEVKVANMHGGAIVDPDGTRMRL